MNAARNAQLHANTRENSKFAVTVSHNLHSPKGKFLGVSTNTRYAADEGQVAEIVAHFEWLNENRTQAGKYFDITVTEV